MALSSERVLVLKVLMVKLMSVAVQSLEKVVAHMLFLMVALSISAAELSKADTTVQEVVGERSILVVVTLQVSIMASTTVGV